MVVGAEVGAAAGAAAGAGDPAIVLRTLFFIGFVPVVGLLLIPWVIETRGQTMPD